MRLFGRNSSVATTNSSIVDLGTISTMHYAARYLLNPIETVELIYRRFGPTVALTPSSRHRGRQTRAFILVGAEHNRSILMRTDVIRPSGLWSVKGPPGSALSAINTHDFLKTHADEHANAGGALYPHVSRARLDGQFKELVWLLIDEIDHWPTDTTVDLYELIRRCSQRAAFGLIFGEKDIARIHKFGDLIFDFHQSGWTVAPFVFPFDLPGTPYRQLMRKAEALRSFVADWISTERGLPAGHNLRSAFAGLNDVDGTPLSIDKITAYFTFFGLAAFETMASALTWCLFLVALHPKIAADLLDEIDAAPTLEDASPDEVDARPLLDGVVQETLRLVPPVPVIPFRVSQECEIVGRKVLRSTKVVLSPHLTHRLPELYESPTRFQPRRWFTIKRSAHEYLPFSAGPRRCPGHWFGTAFLKVGLAAVTTRYRLEFARNASVDWVYQGLTFPRHHIPVMLRRQDRTFSRQSITGSLLDLVEVEGHA